jgi:hypothetical protein
MSRFGPLSSSMRQWLSTEPLPDLAPQFGPAHVCVGSIASSKRGSALPPDLFAFHCGPLHVLIFSAALSSVRFRAAEETPALVQLSDIEQTEDVTMLHNFLDQFRERKSATSDERRGDLECAITRLREMLGINREMTTAYLVELQAAVEAVGRAIKDEQWAREGYSEFLGE